MFIAVGFRISVRESGAKRGWAWIVYVRAYTLAGHHFFKPCEVDLELTDYTKPIAKIEWCRPYRESCKLLEVGFPLDLIIDGKTAKGEAPGNLKSSCRTADLQPIAGS